MSALSTPWGRLPIAAAVPACGGGSAPAGDAGPHPHSAGADIHLCDAAAMLVELVAAHDGVQPGELVARLVAARAEAIGIAGLADFEPCAGREAGSTPSPICFADHLSPAPQGRGTAGTADVVSGRGGAPP